MRHAHVKFFITRTLVGINANAKNQVFTFNIVSNNESNIPASHIPKNWLKKPVRFPIED